MKIDSHELAQLLERCPAYAPGHLNKGKVHLMVGQISQGCDHLATCRDMGRMSPVGRECGRLFRSACPREPGERDQQ